MQPAELFRNLFDSQKRLPLSELSAWLAILLKINHLKPAEAKFYYSRAGQDIVTGHFENQNDPEVKAAPEKMAADEMNNDEILRYEVLGMAYACRQNLYQELDIFTENYSLEKEKAEKILEQLEKKTMHEILSEKFNINIGMMDIDELNQNTGTVSDKKLEYDFVRPENFFKHKMN